MYKLLLRPLLFQFDPEKVHSYTYSAIRSLFKLPFASKIADSVYCKNHPKLERTVFGLKFPNPVGLAAGFDKNALLTDEFAHFGFGFIEIGTVTPRPQPGNPKPRLFRLPQDQAIINRMGFNNQGADVAAHRLKYKKSDIIIGGNIGKNKDTPNENAIQDYEYCFEALFDVVDYFVVNVSSPNTPGLRELQDKEPLTKLLLAVQQKNAAKAKPKPLLLKIAPDLTDSQLNDIVEIAVTTKLSGIIATNTTISRENLETHLSDIEEIGAGGLSGLPLKQRATEVIRFLRQKLPDNIRIIGVGGIMNAEDALEKLAAGADLIQLYTGFIYEGPALVKKINQKIIAQSAN